MLTENLWLKDGVIIKSNMKAKSKALVSMKRSDFIREHKHLLKVLKTHKGETKEFKDQKKELNKI